MKKLVLAASLVLSLSQIAYSEETPAAAPVNLVQLDETFQKANTWLSKQNWSIRT